MKKIFLRAASMALAFTTLILCGRAAAAEDRNDTYQAHEIAVLNVEEETISLSGVVLDRKTVIFESGDSYRAFRLRNGSGAMEPLRFLLEGEGGTASFLNSATSKWQTVALDGPLPDAVLFLETDSASMILGPAVVYAPHGNGSLQDIGTHGRISAYPTKKGYQIEINLTLDTGTEAHLWTLMSEQPLIKWSDEARAAYQRLNLNGKHRICYDGAYYTTPSSYRPTGVGMFTRIPAVHPAVVLLEEQNRASGELAIVLLSEAIKHQDPEGYWPTLAESEWLATDYGIGFGFYDTRFNNDVTMHLFQAYQAFGIKEFRDAALRQADWLIRYAEENHLSVGDGILVEDYGPLGAGVQKPMKTHSSLNHQLQEIKVLLKAHQFTDDQKYLYMAERLLTGIRSTEALWYSKENGLAYAVLPDGTSGFRDYPYLTYNDLFDVQAMLQESGDRDPVLDRLMAAKLRYMLSNNITGYYEYHPSQMPLQLKQVFNELVTINASPSNQKFSVNGVKLPFGAYLINGENHIKLRDLAAALNETESRFSVSYDEENRVIQLEQGKEYLPLGTELSGTSGTRTRAWFSTQSVTRNGKEAALTSYLINGENYYRLRDLSTELGFTVEFDPVQRLVSIHTESSN